MVSATTNATPWRAATAAAPAAEEAMATLLLLPRRRTTTKDTWPVSYEQGHCPTNQPNNER